MTESQGEQPSSTPVESAEPTISPEIAAFVETLMLRGIEAAQGATQSDLMRLNASFITYLDRVVVVAGGALALVFTVVANLSVQLHSIHQSALHPRFVIFSCWFFVVCIITGLLAGWVALKAQGSAAQHAVLLHLDRKMTTDILDKYPTFNRKNLPNFATVLNRKPLQQRFLLLSTVMTVTAYSSLVMAFALLALFVQANISVLLIVR